MSERAMKRYGVRPLAGSPPSPWPASPPRSWGRPHQGHPKVLRPGRREAGRTWGWIELRGLRGPGARRVKELGLDPSRVNPQGGAIALGHPLGRHRGHPGGTLLPRLAPDGGAVRDVTMCIGTGMGAAGLFEALH